MLEIEGQRREQQAGVRTRQALEPAGLGLVVLGRERAGRLSRRGRERVREGGHHRARLERRARVAGRADHECRDRHRGELRIHAPPLPQPGVSYTALSPARLEPVFRAILARRAAIAAVYALLAIPAAWLATRIPEGNAIERMLVESDPDVVATHAFRRVFPENQTLLLLAEAADPLAPEVTTGLGVLERACGRVPGASPRSALTIAARLRPGLAAPERQHELRAFLTQTSFFRRHGLLGADFLSLAIELDARSPRERDVLLAGIEDAVRQAAAESPGGRLPFRLRRVGEAYTNAYLERETAEASRRYFPLFGLFVVGLCLSALPLVAVARAILLTLGAAVRSGQACGGLARLLLHDRLALVPLTRDGHRTASLVYIHSRLRGAAGRACDLDDASRRSPSPTSSSRCTASTSPRSSASRRSRCRRSGRCARWGCGPRGLARVLGRRLHAVSGAAEGAAHPDTAERAPAGRVATPARGAAIPA